MRRSTLSVVTRFSRRSIHFQCSSSPNEPTPALIVMTSQPVQLGYFKGIHISCGTPLI